MLLSQAGNGRGFQLPRIELGVLNGHSVDLEVGHVVVFDVSSASALADDLYLFGGPTSAYYVVKQQVAADPAFGLYCLITQRCVVGARGKAIIQGKGIMRTLGTPAQGAPLGVIGASLLGQNVLTGFLGTKVIARAEALAAGSPQTVPVLFSGFDAWGVAGI